MKKLLVALVMTVAIVGTPIVASAQVLGIGDRIENRQDRRQDRREDRQDRRADRREGVGVAATTDPGSGYAVTSGSSSGSSAPYNLNVYPRTKKDRYLTAYHWCDHGFACSGH